VLRAQGIGKKRKRDKLSADSYQHSEKDKKQKDYKDRRKEQLN